MRCDTKRFVIRYVYVSYYTCTHAQHAYTHCTKRQQWAQMKNLYTHIYLYLFQSATSCWNCVNVNVRLVSIYQVCVYVHTLVSFHLIMGKGEKDRQRERKRKRLDNVQCNDQNGVRTVVWETDRWCGLFLVLFIRSHYLIHARISRFGVSLFHPHHNTLIHEKLR